MRPLLRCPPAPHFNVSSEASSSSEASQQARKPRTEWWKEEVEYLLRLWAENYESINSVHSRKAWKEIVLKFNNKFDSQRRMDLVRRKINYHIQRYKEVRDWNKNKSGGNTRYCNFYDILDGELGTRDIVNFLDIAGAGFVAEEEEAEGGVPTCDGPPDEELPGTCGESAENGTPEPSVEASFEKVSRRTLFRGAERGENQSAIPKSKHINERDERKRGKRRKTREEENDMFENAMTELTKQGSNLVGVAQKMEEHAKQQTEAIQQLTQVISMYFRPPTRSPMKSSVRRGKSATPRKRRHREWSDESDTY